MTSYYAVKVGHQTGVFRTSAEASKQVAGFPNSQMRKFDKLADAKAYLHSPTTCKTYYVVLAGNYPGIYTNKQLANKQLIGYSNGLMKTFTDLSKARHCLLNNLSKIIKNKIRMLFPKCHTNDVFYLVTRGRQPGIYTDFNIAHQQVYEYPNGYLKKYNDLSSLRKAIPKGNLNLWKSLRKQYKAIDGKYYVVIKGMNPGIYINYDDAAAQTVNYPEGYFQVFNSLKNAEYFILTHQMLVIEPDLKSVYVGKNPKKPKKIDEVISLDKRKVKCYYGFRAGRYSKVFANKQDLLNAIQKHPNGWFQSYSSLSKAIKFISEYNPARSKFVNFKATVYTDGGFAHNQTQHGSWAYLINTKFHRAKIHDSGSLFKVTGSNNYMELYALHEALKELIKLDYNKRPIRFILDSQYVLNIIINNDCQVTNGNDAIVSLWQDVSHLLKQFQIVCFDWTKGHAGNIGNEFVDAKASQELKLIDLSQVTATIS